MVNNLITWEQFKVCGKNPLGLRYDFEDLCRLLFEYEFVSNGDFLHSNPNQTGIEVEPYFHAKTNKRISFQAKFFENKVDYNQIFNSAKKIVKYYNGKLVSNVRLFKDSLVKIIGDIFDSYDSLINLFGGQCQII